MVLGTLTVLGAAGASAAYYTAANVRSAGYSKSSGSAYSLAEAGIATSLSILHAALDPRTGTLLPQTTITLPEGTATYSGALDANYIWRITSTGAVNNPDGPASADATRTLTRNVEIRGLNNGATVGAWSRIYHNNTSNCLDRRHGGAEVLDHLQGRSLPEQRRQDHRSRLEGLGRRRRHHDAADRAISTPDENPAAATGWSNNSNVYTDERQLRDEQHRRQRAEPEPRRDQLRLCDPGGCDDRGHQRPRGAQGSELEPHLGH